MGESLNKAIGLGVGIFITLLIVSGVITIFSQMQQIYSNVSNTDTNVTTRFGKFAMYDNTEITGLDLVNCANKYYNENLVVVSYSGRDLNNADGVNYLQELVDNGTLKYEDKFRSTVEEVEYDGVDKTKISFTKM